MPAPPLVGSRADESKIPLSRYKATFDADKQATQA
jgi:hypothetical protein